MKKLSTWPLALVRRGPPEPSGGRAARSCANTTFCASFMRQITQVRCCPCHSWLTAELPPLSNTSVTLYACGTRISGKLEAETSFS